MTVTINHSTPADGTFSAAGAIAWDATHTFTGVLDVANGGTGATTTAAALTSLGAYPASNPSGFTSNTGTVTSVAATAGTGISITGSPITTSGTLNITNTAPDQTVVLTSGTGISTSGTYPNFTITNTSPSLGGDVVGPASATDNAVARYNTTTGKLIQNSAVIIDDTNNVTGVNSLTAATLVVNDNATLGGSNADTLAVNSRITTDLEPNANNAKDIGTSGRNWRDGFFGRTLHTVNLDLTGTTSFDGAQGTSGQVLTSAGTGNTPTWTTPTTGTVTSVAATAGTGISISGSPITSSGTLTITNTAPDQTVAIAAGTGISVSGTYPSFTITNTASGGGTVTAVTGTAPVVSSGGATPAISMPAATTSVDGYLTSTDWNTFNNKTSNTGTVTSVAATVPSFLSVSGSPITTSGTLAISYSGTALPVANGGTGATSAAAALTSLGAYPSTNPSGFTSNTGTVTSVGGTGTVNGITLTGTVTTAGNLTLGGTLSGVSLSTQVTGTLPIANGGTGQTTQTAAFDALAPTTTKGDLIVSNGTDNVRLPVGADTYSLVADSTQATGVRWSASAGAGVSQIIAGTNITISPTGGTGVVTINSSGGGGGGSVGFEQTFLLMGA